MVRVAVVADTAELCTGYAALLAGLGHEAWTAVGGEAAAALVEQCSPAVALLSSDAPSPRLRALVRRVRAAAERALPVVLALPEGAWWLRVAPAADLSPIALVRRSGLTAAALEVTLQRLGVSPGGTAVRPTLTLDAPRRRLTGSEGSVRLTPAEGAMVAALLATPGEVVDVAALCLAVWSGPVDQHRLAALRTHVYALRRKLRLVGAADVLTNEPSRGYRLAMS